MISKDQKKNINCNMEDVRYYFFGPPHSTTPASVTTNKNTKVRSFKCGLNIQKKEGGPDCTVPSSTATVYYIVHVPNTENIDRNS